MGPKGESPLAQKEILYKPQKREPKPQYFPAISSEPKILGVLTSQLEVIKIRSCLSIYVSDLKLSIYLSAAAAAAAAAKSNNTINMADTPDWRTQLHSGSRQRIYAPDWRIQLESGSRQRIVNKIMDYLKRHLPISGPEGLLELSKIAVRFEEKIYTAATSQSDYLRKISLKMLSMETKSQNTAVVNSIPQNAVASNQNPPNPAQGAGAGSGSGAGAVQNCMVDAPDWRIQLQAVSRQRIVNKIMDTLKRFRPISSPEELHELTEIAVRFEEKIYSVATSQSDYLRKISLKMLTMEAKYVK